MGVEMIYPVICSKGQKPHNYAVFWPFQYGGHIYLRPIFAVFFWKSSFAKRFTFLLSHTLGQKSVVADTSGQKSVVTRTGIKDHKPILLKVVCVGTL